MQAREKKKLRDVSLFRQEYMTFWPRSHPVMYPHLQTDHWSKMKTKVPVYLASFPAALLKDRDALNCTTTSSSLLPPLSQDLPSKVQGGYSLHKSTAKTSCQNMVQYRNEFNDRAKRGFCYWLIEKKGSTCKGKPFGSYKTFMGLSKV